MEVENIFYELFKLTAERSDGSTLPEGGIDLDISRPSTIYHYLDQHRAQPHLQQKKRKGNTSTDSEGLTGSPKRRRKFLRTSDNYAVSLRKLTKQVGDLGRK
ncbi:hypothetical protein NQ318_003247 [Aromia moschata]|uniref:Uncharacterized protein n=1 Tax=Aromia moschata TaxID=1265417 RepID=A0AAV8X565_9CUCU|nr:hypothetical protein NQ318_003247 [Aromia moschata]